MKICSLLPSATEILFALGLGDAVVGVSHACDFPAEVRDKPRVLRCSIAQDHDSSAAIDQAVRDALGRRESLYQIDTELMRRLQPDLVITQDLCDVCAVSAPDVRASVEALSPRPEVIALHPHTLGEMLEDIRTIGRRTGRRTQAQDLVNHLAQRIDRLRRRMAGSSMRPRVFCFEWLQPPMATGHWVPEMVELAGGREVLGQTGKPSRYVDWTEITTAKPEVLVLMPCGFSIERTRRECDLLRRMPGWLELPAVVQRRVYALDAAAYFNRSGPRLVDGVDILARLIHPARAGVLPNNPVECIMP